MRQGIEIEASFFHLVQKNPSIWVQKEVIEDCKTFNQLQNLNLVQKTDKGYKWNKKFLHLALYTDSKFLDKMLDWLERLSYELEKDQEEAFSEENIKDVINEKRLPPFPIVRGFKTQPRGTDTIEFVINLLEIFIFLGLDDIVQKEQKEDKIYYNWMIKGRNWSRNYKNPKIVPGYTDREIISIALKYPQRWIASYTRAGKIDKLNRLMMEHHPDFWRRELLRSKMSIVKEED